jgi:zinc D-Ala-D-Ala carboxypeptidase
MGTTKVVYPANYNLSKWMTFYDGISYDSAIWRNILNIPTDVELKNIIELAKHIYDPICDHFNVKVPTTTVFRNDELNKAVGGAVGSQHAVGQAVDIKGNSINIKNSDIFMFVANNLDYDQMIWEKGDINNSAWVHVSFVGDGSRKNRKKLTTFNNGVYKHAFSLNEFLDLKKVEYK